MKKLTIIKLSVFIISLIGVLCLSSCNDECSHEYMSETVTEPTHEEEGMTTFMCLNCDYMYHTDYVAPLGHTMRKEIHTPTCTEEGYTYNYCECGYHFNTDIVPPSGHTLSIEETAATCDNEGYKAATCTVCGHHYTYAPTAPLGHDLKCESRTFISLNERTGQATFTCDRCDFAYDTYLLYSNIFKGAFADNSQALAKGVDVSKFQHETDENGKYLPLDWTKVKAAGYNFAILRTGYMGSGNVGVVDPVYEMNYADARAAGLELGAYFFSYAYSIEDARAEAEFLLTLLDGKTFEYPIYFDIEYSDEKIAQKGLTKDTLTDICCEFITILQENGYYAALYTNNKWLTNYLNADVLTELVDVWYARYPTTEEIVNDAKWNDEWFGKQMAMWQFSSTGTIDGIKFSSKTNDLGTDDVIFDLNYAYKDYPTLIKSLGYNGFELIKDASNLDGKYSEGE